MHIALITRTLPPNICGIGDHSIFFADALRAFGHEVTIIAGLGKTGDNIHIIDDDWSKRALSDLLERLSTLDLDHVILQFTPLLYEHIRRKSNFALVKFWNDCGRRWHTSIILHETYFRVWWHPLSWIIGTRQKRLMKLLVRSSHNVYSASQPLIAEVNKQFRKNNKAVLLPIGSNFAVTSIDRNKMRSEQHISPDEIVLTLFGGGSALRWARHYMNHTDHFLQRNGVKIRWLFLGGDHKNLFNLTAPVMSPGILPPADLSAWLQLTDIFLMPHFYGLSAKRGTLMAALQHGLPVVGTKVRMTDHFWEDVAGVTLTPFPNSGKFSRAVLKLCKDPDLRQRHGRENKNYFHTNFVWENIAGRFLSTLSKS